MATRLKIDLTARSIEIDGEDDFVQSVYRDLRDHLPSRQSAAGEPAVERAQEGFDELLDEARISASWSEYHRSYSLFGKAFQMVPKGAAVRLLAEILEGIDQMRSEMERVEGELPALKAAVENDPDDAEKRFYLASALSSLGRDDEALAHYESALSNPAALCEECFRDTWNNIGWFYFRREDFREALKWFEQTYQIALSNAVFSAGNCTLAIENKILCFSALGMAAEAEAAVREYVRRCGRLPWPERRALARLDIDADAIYLQHREAQRE